MWRVEAFLTEYAHAIDDDDLERWLISSPKTRYIGSSPEKVTTPATR